MNHTYRLTIVDTITGREKSYDLSTVDACLQMIRSMYPSAVACSDWTPIGDGSFEQRQYTEHDAENARVIATIKRPDPSAVDRRAIVAE